MKNLGKIVLFFILLSTAVHADVVARVEPSTIYSGDMATYTLTISGENAKKPIIDSICGNDVTATSSQTSIQSINGNYQKSYTLSYQFTPMKSCTIEPVSLEINGKMEKSNSVNVEVKPVAQDANADFILSLTPSKTELYVGEPFSLTLLLRQKNSAEAVDSKFVAPEFKGFWTKSETQPQRYNEADYIVTKVVYKLAPQRAGSLSIKPAELKIASRIGTNNWGTLIPQVRWRTYFSNEVEINAKALPNGANIIGDFTIEAKAEKTEINPNEAVNLSIKVVGDGNLEDIKSFKPYVKDVNVFDEKITVNENTLTQKLVFVSDKDFTIPAFNLTFFNPKTGKVEALTTEPINVKVSGDIKTSELKIKRDEAVVVPSEDKENLVNNVEMDKVSVAVAFVVGLILGVLLMLLGRVKKSAKTKKIDVKDEKLLLVKLLPFSGDDVEVKRIVDILEQNIYSAKKEPLDKKVLKELLKKYDIN